MREFIDLVQNLNEAVFYQGEMLPKYSKFAVDILILKNPTKGELQRLKAKSQFGELRGMLDNELLVWDAEVATHGDVSKFFNVDGSDLHLEDGGVRVNDCDDMTDEEAQQMADWIRTHPAVIRLYGPDVRLELEAPDAMKTWNF